MIGVIATIKARQGAGADFEAAAKQLVAAVTANEPGCLFYQLHRAEEPDTYVFLEAYKDQASLEAHRGTDHFKELGGAMGPFMAGRPTVQIMQAVD